MLLRFDFSKNLDLNYFSKQFENCLLNKKKREFQIVFDRFRIFVAVNQKFQYYLESFPENKDYDNVVTIICAENLTDKLVPLKLTDERLEKINIMKDSIFQHYQIDAAFGFIKINNSEDISVALNVIKKIIQTFFKMQKMAAFWD